MAEVRIPFSATAELQAPFMLEETFSSPNGIKSVLFDKNNLKVMGRLETIDVPVFGKVQILVYSVVGAIPYICNAFPIVKSGAVSDVQDEYSVFNGRAGNRAADMVSSISNESMGWLSASGYVNINAPIGAAGSFEAMPSVQSVDVENLSVANNLTTTLVPPASEAAAGETETKRVVKWWGEFVIRTE